MYVADETNFVSDLALMLNNFCLFILLYKFPGKYLFIWMPAGSVSMLHDKIFLIYVLISTLSIDLMSRINN